FATGAFSRRDGVPAHQSVGARCRVGRGREKGAAIFGVCPHYSAPGGLFPHSFIQNPPAFIWLSAQPEANCRSPVAARRTKGMGRSRLVQWLTTHLRRGRFRDPLSHLQCDENYDSLTLGNSFA